MADAQLARTILQACAEEFLDRAKRLTRQVESAGGLAIFDDRHFVATRDDWESSQLAGGTLAEMAADGFRECGTAIMGLTRFSVDAADLIERAVDSGHIEEEFAGFENHGLDKVSDEAVAELDAGLNAVITAWVIRHDIRAECAKEIVDRVKIGAVDHG